MREYIKYKEGLRKAIRYLILMVFMLACLVLNSQAQNGADDQSKIGEELDQFANRFLDWVVLSYATYTGQHEAELASIFAKAKESLEGQEEIRELLRDLMGSSDENGLEQVVRDFTNKSGIGVYFVPQIANENDGFYVPIFNNFLAEGAKNPIAPYVIVHPLISGNHKSGYNVSYSIETSPDLSAKKYNLDQANANNPFNGIAGSIAKRKELASKFKPNLAAGVKTLTANVDENFLPKLVITYEGNVYRPGEEIEMGMDTTAEIRLIATNRDGTEPKRSVVWSFAPETVERKVRGSDLLFPLSKPGQWAILAESGSMKATVGVKVVDFNLDWKQIVKTLLYELLRGQLDQAQAKIDSLEVAGAGSNAELQAQLKKIEAANYPLESDGSQLYSIYDEPQVLSGEDTVRFYSNDTRAKSFKALRKFKKHAINTLSQVNLAAFIDILIEDSGRFDDFLDGLTDNSAALILEIVDAGLDPTERDGKIKSVVIDYLNANLEQLADAEFSDKHYEPRLVAQAVPPTSTTIPTAQDPNFYISPLVEFPEKEAFTAELKATLDTMANPPFVVINYSQDLSTEGYLERASPGRPKGLDEGRDYIVFTQINIPGSVKLAIMSSDKGENMIEIVKNRSSTALALFVDFDNPKLFMHPEIFTGDDIIYVSPSGAPIALSKNTVPSFTGFVRDVTGAAFDLGIPSGALLSFKEGERIYGANFSKVKGAYKFNGYKLKSSDPKEFKKTKAPGKTRNMVLTGEVDEYCFLGIYSGYYEHGVSEGEPYDCSGPISNREILLDDKVNQGWLRIDAGCTPSIELATLKPSYIDILKNGFVVVDPADPHGVMFSYTMKNKDGNDATGFVYRRYDDQQQEEYFLWNGIVWEKFELSKNNQLDIPPDLLTLAEMWEAIKNDPIHSTLDLAGFIPVIGMAADGLNAVIYFVEGDHVAATLSSIAIVSSGIVVGVKAIAKISKATKKVKLAVALSDDFATKMEDVIKVAHDGYVGNPESWYALQNGALEIAAKYGDEGKAALLELSTMNNKVDFLKIADKINKLENAENFIADLGKSDFLNYIRNSGESGVNSWEVLFKEGDEIAAALRRNPDNLKKLNDYVVAEGADLTKLKNSFGNTAYPEKWLELKIPKNKLDETFTTIKNDPPANIDPWTPEHKAQRWNNYKEGDGTLDFESWSNSYDGNINKAVKGNKKVKDYAGNNGLDIPESGFERTWPDDLTIELRGQNVTGKRRHDIYDVDSRKAIEVKEYNTQNVSKSVDIEREALMDIKLLQQGRVSEIEWVFLGNGPSAPLRALLESGGIKIIP